MFQYHDFSTGGAHVKTAEWTPKKKKKKKKVSGSATGGHGGISPPKNSSPQIMKNVLKLDQIWCSQHENVKNGNFLHVLCAFFTFPPTKIFSCPSPFAPQFWC